jgi:hypothetical protein
MHQSQKASHMDSIACAVPRGQRLAVASGIELRRMP